MNIAAQGTVLEASRKVKISQILAQKYQAILIS